MNNSNFIPPKGQQPPRKPIKIEQTTPFECEECKSDIFKEVLFLRKASKFITKELNDSIMPIPTFACAKCNHVNKEFQIKIIAANV